MWRAAGVWAVMADFGGGTARFWGSDTGSTGGRTGCEISNNRYRRSAVGFKGVIPVVRGAQPTVG